MFQFHGIFRHDSFGVSQSNNQTVYRRVLPGSARLLFSSCSCCSNRQVVGTEVDTNQKTVAEAFSFVPKQKSRVIEVRAEQSSAETDKLFSDYVIMIKA